jgi:hypothetical protein
MPKEKRGIATSLVAGIGLSGAVFAYFIRVWFVGADGDGWRMCYYIGGGLGLVLLLLRIGVLESGMYKSVASTKVSRGNFLMLFTNGRRFRKYLTSILIALPNWFVIGILLTFSDKFAAKMNVQGTVDPGKAVMVAYIFVSIGDILIGFISQGMKSRKNALWLFHAITAGAVIWFFNLQGQTSTMLYVVCIFLGFGTGFWAMFVTMAAEQFGTNIRATVATTVPNMARGSLWLVSTFFVWIQTKLPPDQAYLKGAWITGILIFVIASLSLALTDETFGKDLDYIEQ